MKREYLEKMFTQSVVWGEVIKADSSLTEETTKSHDLQYVRISQETNGRTTDKEGEAHNSMTLTKLYILRNVSVCDDSFKLPEMKFGDEIVTATGRTMIVEDVRTLYGVGGEVHHLEVTLK